MLRVFLAAIRVYLRRALLPAGSYYSDDDPIEDSIQK